MGVAGDLAEIKAGVLAMGSGGEYGVAAANVRADAVGEGDEEPRGQLRVSRLVVVADRDGLVEPAFDLPRPGVSHLELVL